MSIEGGDPLYHPDTPKPMRELHELEQSMAVMADTFPPMWYRTFANLMIEGFSREEALTILRAYVHGLAGGRLQ